MPMSFEIQVSLELWGIDEISIVGEANAVRAVYIKRLSLGVCATACSGIPQVTNAHGARKVCYFGTILENLGCHTIGLELIDSTTRRASSNTDGILTTIYYVKDSNLSLVIVQLCGGVGSVKSGFVGLAKKSSFFDSSLTLKEIEGFMQVNGSGG